MALIIGTSSSDSRKGTPDADTIFGLGAGDNLLGGDGNDSIDAELLATANQILAVPATQDWHQSTPGIADIAQQDDYFGLSVLGGDFNGDGYDDLAIGAPLEDLSSTAANAGVVHILRGSSTGTTATNSQYLHQDITGVVEIAEGNDFFGAALAAGDFNGDSYEDLAIGVDHESVSSTAPSSGAVHVFQGAASGLSITGNRTWSQNSSGVENVAETGDGFGESLTVGDFNGDGYDDLAIGVPTESFSLETQGLISRAGAVNVLQGSSNGLTGSNDQFLHQDGIEIQGDIEANDFFGQDLATGDFNGDGYDDLAIGVPGENIEPLNSAVVQDAGVVQILEGSDSGLSDAGLFYQDTPGVLGVAEQGDNFGSSLAVGDFNGDGYDDLVVGAPYEDIDTAAGLISNAGAVHVFRGSATGLSTVGDQLWHEDVAGIDGEVEAGDLFGSALTVGDFNGDGFDDLAIAKRFGISDTEVQILFGSNSGLTATNDTEIFVSGGSNGLVSLGSGDFNADGYDDLAIGVPLTTINSQTAAGTSYVLFGSNTGF